MEYLPEGCWEEVGFVFSHLRFPFPLRRPSMRNLFLPRLSPLKIRTHCFSVSSKRIKNVVKSSPEADLRQKKRRKIKEAANRKTMWWWIERPPGPLFRDPEARPDHCARCSCPCLPSGHDHGDVDAHACSSRSAPRYAARVVGYSGQS